jgi:hypothetical protein
LPIADCQLRKRDHKNRQSTIGNWQLAMANPVAIAPGFDRTFLTVIIGSRFNPSFLKIRKA